MERPAPGPRPDERTDGGSDGSPADLTSLAADLRALRVAAGAPSYATLARRTGVPRSTLHDALGGDRFPSRETVVALAEALGGDSEVWGTRWAAVRLATDEPSPPPTEPPTEPSTKRSTELSTELPTEPGTEPPSGPPAEGSARPSAGRPAPRSRRRWWLVAAVVVVLLGAGGLTWALTRDDCVPGERYSVSTAGDLLDARGGVLERLDAGETVVVTDKHPPEYRSRYRAVSDDSGATGFVDESKIDPVGDAC